MSITKKSFGKLPDGREVSIFSLINASGAEVRIMDYGATVTNIFMPDREGTLADVIGGFDTLEEYMTAEGYQGATIGRYSNRIAKSRFTLDGIEYNLSTNEYANQLHGGICGFDKKIWNVNIVEADEPTIEFTYLSPDNEEGFPGNLSVTTKYVLTDDNSLIIDYKATTDKRTPVSLTNHSYFNIGGYDRGTVKDQLLMIDADAFLETDSELIPTGKICSVENTPFDFRTPKEIGRDIEADDINIKYGNGYDSCFVFTKKDTKEIAHRVTVYDNISGRRLDVYTDQPCIQIYTYNKPTDPDHPLKNGTVVDKYSFICLETEVMPDSVNHSHFTNAILNVGETYSSTTIYKFSVK